MNAAEKKVWIDSINRELSNLREWANDAERRVLVETSAKEAAEAERDQLKKELEGFKPVRIEELLGDQAKLEAAEAERDRAVRALREIMRVVLKYGIFTDYKDADNETGRAIELAMSALSPVPVPAPTNAMSDEMKAHRRRAFAPDEVAAIEKEHEDAWIREKAAQEDGADVRAGTGPAPTKEK